MAERTGGFNRQFGEVRAAQQARVVIPPSLDGGTLAPLVSLDDDLENGETF